MAHEGEDLARASVAERLEEPRHATPTLVEPDSVSDLRTRERDRSPPPGAGADDHAFLADSVVALLDADPEELPRRLATALVPRVADVAIVDLLGPRALRPRVALVHADADKGASLDAVETRWGPLLGVSMAMIHAFQSGRTRSLSLSSAELVGGALNGEHAAALVGLALCTWVIVPLVDGEGRALGALRLATAGRRPLEDVSVAERLAAVGGRALGRALADRATRDERTRRRESFRAFERQLDVAVGLARAVWSTGRSANPAALVDALERVRARARDLGAGY